MGLSIGPEEMRRTVRAKLAAGSEGAARARVLVVDDDWNIRELLAKRLGMEGYEVIVAMDGEEGLRMLEQFDGHANCFIESGFGKGLLIDFNYDTEPLPGKYPLPGIGPFSLLQETVTNHWGKMMFRWVYWNMLLRGRELPLPAEMSMYGKER